MLSVDPEFVDKLTESIYSILNGRKVPPISIPPDRPDDEIRQLVHYLNRLISEYDSFAELMYSLSRGEMDHDPPKGGLKVVHSFKSLQSNLRHLTWVSQQIAAGHFDHKVDFMGDFSIAFNKMARDLKDAFERIEAQRRQLEQANSQIMESIQYAQSIQRAILPRPESIRACVDDHFVIWRPRDIIGGDLFWIAGGPDLFMAAIMDCTGHGVPGAIITMVAGAAMNRIFSERGFDDPARLLSRMSEMVRSALSRREESLLYDDGLDMAICRVDRQNRTLDFAGARMSLFHTGDGRGIEIKGDNRSIGYRSSDTEYRFQSHRVRFESSACFYMLTDGMIEQPCGEKRIPFGKTRFLNFITECHSKPLAEQKNALWDLFTRQRGGESPRDDITVLAFRV